MWGWSGYYMERKCRWAICGLFIYRLLTGCGEYVDFAPTYCPHFHGPAKVNQHRSLAFSFERKWRTCSSFREFSPDLINPIKGTSHLDTWVYIMPLLTSIWPWSYHKYNLAKFQRDNSPQSHCEVTLSLYLDIFVRKSDTQSNLGRTTSLDLGHFWKISHPLSNPNQPQVSS